MKKLFLVWTLGLGAATVWAGTIVIVPQLAAKTEESDPNVSIAHPLAEAIETEAGTTAVIWSESDPKFRSWMEKGWATTANAPTDAEIRSAMQAAGAEFRLNVSGFKVDGQVQGSIFLMNRDGRILWRDSKMVIVRKDGLPDWTTTAESLARTWMITLKEGALKKFFKDGSVISPTDPTPSTRQPEQAPETRPEVKTILAQAQRQQTQGLLIEAVLTLREGVDLYPEDAEIRGGLVSALVLAGRLDLAAMEADRYSKLGGPAQVASARIWLELDRLDEAQRALNEAKARTGESAGVLWTQAAIHLAGGDLALAFPAFKRAHEMAPTQESALGLAVVAAFQGQSEVLSPLKPQLSGAETPESLKLYRWMVHAMDARMDFLAEQFRDALRYASGQPKSQAAAARCAKVLSIAETLNDLLDAVKPPKIHSSSHELRQLAHKLLVQAGSDCAAFARSGDEESGSEATLSLSEALKSLAPATEKYKLELTGR